MAKRIVAKTGEYQKDGQTKGEYTRVGVVLSNQNGEYMLLDPAVSLAGLLVKQNALAASKGEQIRDNVMISIFEDDNQGQQQNNNQGYQNNQNQQQYQNNNQQNNMHQNNQQYQNNNQGHQNNGQDF
ncbi:coil containing protein [Vibrio phage 1.029.O._10N.261.55.A7]|nr:coil containing protein [Vibrio phage 1.029.O._10N.261.55.A7]